MGDVTYTELEQAAALESREDPFGIMVDLLRQGGTVILSGAGLSTESGIPDYRGPSGRQRRGQPMTYQTFTGSEEARQRYWARSHLGWRHITGAAPNAGHSAVAVLEKRGHLNAIITQNVDGLHQAAGAANVTELHGSLHRVTCLSCWRRTTRTRLHERLAVANPDWDDISEITVNPDGDVALEETTGFTVVDCEACGGMLKPDVVFFGENVPKPRAERCYTLVGAARSLIVLGSSLTVMSGFRYVRHAAKHGIPVVIVNQGETRGDVLATATLDAPLGATLTAALAAI